MWSVAWQLSVSPEIDGQTFKVKILCILTGHVQLLGCRCAVCAELGLTRAELLPDECVGNRGAQGKGMCKDGVKILDCGP